MSVQRQAVSPARFDPILKRSADDDCIGQSLEVSVASHERCAEAASGGVDEGVSHRETVGQGKISCLQGKRFVDRRDGRAAKGRDRLDRALLADIAPDYFVDFVDFDGTHEQRLAAFYVGGEAVRVRPTGQILDPAARIDQNQWRSFFSRSPLRLVPRAIPR